LTVKLYEQNSNHTPTVVTVFITQQKNESNKIRGMQLYNYTLNST